MEKKVEDFHSEVNDLSNGGSPSAGDAPAQTPLRSHRKGWRQDADNPSTGDGSGQSSGE